jgi:hypothetical protein
MFDFFSKREQKPREPVPLIEPPKSEPVPVSVYSIGTTTEGTHMTFRMGYSTLTMNKIGCQQLIDQLEVFKNQLHD